MINRENVKKIKKAKSLETDKILDAHINQQKKKQNSIHKTTGKLDRKG